jgi:hypothetical protein
MYLKYFGRKNLVVGKGRQMINIPLISKIYSIFLISILFCSYVILVNYVIISC